MNFRTFFLSCYAAAGVVFAAGAASIEDFENTKPSDVNYIKEKRDAAVELLQAPGIKGPAVKISWNADKFKYAELTLNKRKALSSFEEGSLKVKVYAPENSPVHRFNLRLIDAKGEIFQWDKAVSFKKGWQEIIFNITPENYSISWGGNKDKKLDQPVKFLGFGIDYKRNSGKSFIWVDDVRFSSGQGDKVNCTVSAAAFDGNDKITVSSYGGSFTQKQNPASLNIFGNAHTYLLKKRKWTLKGYKIPEKLSFVANLKSGKGRFSLKLRGSDNKALKTENVSLRPGFAKYNVTIDRAGLKQPVFIDYLTLNAQGNLDIEVKKLDLIYKDYPVNAIKVDIETGTPVHVLKAGDEKKLKLRFSNISDAAISFAANIELINFFGQKISFAENLTLSPHSSQALPSPALPTQYGIWWVNYAITDKNVQDSAAGGQLSFAYMKPAGPTPGTGKGFLFGMCTHTERWGKRDRQLEVLAAALCGAKIIRTSPSWGSVEKTPGKYDWTMFDESVEEYGKKGMELQPILAFTPRWAAPARYRNSKNWLDWSRRQPDLKAYAKYSRDAAARYKGKIRFWEVWNEPDLSGFFNGTSDQYLQMLKAAYKAVKKGNPQALVLTGGFASMLDHPGRSEANFQENTISKGKGFYDIHAYHQHGSFSLYQQAVSGKFLPMRQKHGVTVPWYANETAIASMDGAERMQAETLYKKILYAWSRGAIAYNWYDLRNDGFDPKEHEHNYGILTNDFYPKAGYPAYNALALYFSGMKFNRQLNLGENLWAFVFKRDSRIIIPAWNEETASSGKHIVIKTDAQKAEKLDIMGNLTPLPLTDGMTVLEVTPVPAALYLTGAGYAKPAGGLLDITNSQIAVPGKKLSCPVEVRNPFNQEKSFQISLVLPSGITAASNTTEVQVPARGKKIIKLDFNVTRDLKDKRFARLKLLYSIAGTPWHGSIAIPVNLATLIPAGSLNRKPDFSINTRKNVVGLCEADPSKSHLVWKDANDLSADIRLGTDGKNLLLKIDAVDDVHRQDDRGMAVWKGDNVQLGIMVPGQETYWEIGLTRLNSGKSEVYIWGAPGKFDKKQVAKLISLQCTRKGKTTGYLAKIPLSAIGATAATLKSGIRFNLLINDNDAGIREGWIHIAPGIGESKNPDKFPFLIFE